MCRVCARCVPLIDSFVLSDSTVSTDPVTCCGHSSVHAGIVGLGTADAPRNDPDELTIGDQRATRISLAGVSTSSLESCTDHTVSDTPVQGICGVAAILVVGRNVRRSKDRLGLGSTL